VRIPCHVRKFVSGRLFCFLPFSLRFSHCFGFIEALVDTGSPFTVLSPTDALRLKLPITTMRTGSPVSLAGFRFLNHPLEKANLNFKKEDGQYYQVEMKIGVLVPTKTDKAALEAVKHIPSLIGNDFLEDHKLSLVFNPSAKVAFLNSE
jgi:hypothetical protein